MGVRAARLCCVVILLGGAVAATVAAEPERRATNPAGPAAAWHQSPGEPGAVAEPSRLDRDSVLLRVTVRADGSAHWRVEYRTRLDDRNTSAAFRSLQADLRRNPERYSDRFFDRIHATVAAAENATGREMAVGNFSVDTHVRRLPQAYGVLVYSFTWREFVTSADNRIRAGDALSGFFLGGNERLLLSWPDGYRLVESRPAVDARRTDAVVWTGPTEFGPGEPSVVLAPVGAPDWLPWLAAVVALFAAGVAIWALDRRRQGGVSTPARRVLDGGESGRELLSNEERVVRLLERRGGRAKQRDVAEELGWTESKTSHVVTALRDEGRLDCFRLGRENVLSLPDEDD